VNKKNTYSIEYQVYIKIGCNDLRILWDNELCGSNKKNEPQKVKKKN